MIIWITGASSGLGRELALQYAKASHAVYASARNLDALNKLCSDAQDLPGVIYPVALDITDMVNVDNCINQMKEKSDVSFPDLAILNAGTYIENPVKDFDRNIYTRLMGINYIGTINCLQGLIPEYAQRGYGKIAIVSSVAGYRGLPKASAYGASKAALINLCESLQPELKTLNIDLRLINPGFVRTPLTDLNEFPMPFLMEVDKAAERIIKGLSKNNFEITFPRRFTWILKILRLLPYRIYLNLTKNILKND
ncbi:MAG: SDR family NAD(P)-dependent oxidoreductase [Pseudomonadota bacterium]|nr:SDR family NAD(P)-dependent oxidoreductase [Pseudomonadota bacterium]